MIKEDKLYYIGGIVRDELLKIPSLDTDLCYEGNAIEFAQKQGLNIIKTNNDFGTVRVLEDSKEIDIASTRTETYPRKGHLPKVDNIGCPLREDLKRRDFTINAMAKRTSDGELIDYFNGLDDIKNKIIRVLHKNSFIDDPTRIIRGLKFSVRFGFELSEETKKLQDEYLNNINYDMSYHRIRKELIETFNLDSAEAYDKFVEQGIYKLLGDCVKIPKIKGEQIKNVLKNFNTKYVWLFYLMPFVESGFNPDIIYLTRAEKRIIEWAEKLKKLEPANNTPEESIIIRRMFDNV